MVMIEPRIDRRTETVTNPEAASNAATATHRFEALQAAAAWWLLEARLRDAIAEETSRTNPPSRAEEP